MGRPYARVFSLAVVLTAALFAVASGVSPATASTVPAAPATTMVRVPMKVVGFDAKVAAAHGYALRKEANGATELVNVRTGSVVPQDTVKGNCGYSWYYLSNRSASTWTFWTGFYIYPIYGAAYDYTWHTHVTGPAGYSQSDDFGGLLEARARWESKNERFHAFGARGTYVGAVTSGHAITLLGFVCYTGYPFDKLAH